MKSCFAKAFGVLIRIFSWAGAKASDTAAEEDSEFKYTQQYFDYHRNMLLFFSLCLLITWTGLGLDVEKVAYLTGDKYFINKWLPWVLLAIGCYHGLLFIPEWRACASPHWNRVKSTNAKIIDKLQGLNAANKRIDDLLVNHLETIESQWLQLQIENASQSVRGVRREALKRFEEEMRDKVSQFRSETQKAYSLMRFESKNPGPGADLIEAFDEIRLLSKDPYDQKLEDQIAKITAAFEIISYEYVEAEGKVLECAKRMITNARHYTVIQSSFESNKINSEDNLRSLIQSYIAEVSEYLNKVPNLVNEIRESLDSVMIWRFAGSFTPWLKVYFGGVIIPVMFFVMSIIGVFTRDVEVEPLPFCAFDLTITDKICRLQP